jgi:tryptophanyl-tRNA synthetase
MSTLAARRCFSSAKRSVLLTGIQATGDLHIGNYLGAVKNMLQLQEEAAYHQKYLMIADYHSLTTALSHEHSKMTFNERIGADTFEMAKVLLASGVDPKRMCVFVQSQNPAHCELAWIFSCIAPEHWLNNMIQYKEKSHDNSSVGLYTYPILMAVDILLYQANHVPVGVDQLQHLELTNKFAGRFNKQFKTTFFPKVRYVESSVSKVMSLTDPSKKMSKS